MAAQATAGRDGSFASEIINLIVEGCAGLGLDWNDYKRQLPGYESAMKVRRLRAAASEWNRSALGADLESFAAGLAALSPEQRSQVLKKAEALHQEQHPPKSRAG